MILKALQLYNFKNFPQRTFSFARGINAITGNNGVGKTNILDAINLLAFGKSYMHLPLSMIIRHGETEFSVKGIFETADGAEETVLFQYRKGERRILKRNGKVYERLSEHIGFIPVVMISPYDRDLITETGEVRRKFIDKIISQFDKNYLSHLTGYYKFLSQRNSLLKYFAFNNTFDADTLEVIDEKMDALAGKIYEKRREFIDRFRPFLKEKYRWLSEGKEDVDVRYRSDLEEKPLRTWLKESLSRDSLLQHTTKGIHRDDLIFLINGYPIKKFGSQGQQKSYLIALKLSEFEILKENQQRLPVLLFDDIFDKLDAGRVKQIVRLVETGTFGQIFLTDTHPERLKELLKDTPQENKIIHL